MASIAAFVSDVFTMPQQLAAGSTIDDATIVSQQAARRQTSRPHSSADPATKAKRIARSSQPTGRKAAGATCRRLHAAPCPNPRLTALGS